MIRGQLQAHLIKILDPPCKPSIVGPNRREVENVNKVAQEKNMNANVWILEASDGDNCVNKAPE